MDAVNANRRGVPVTHPADGRFTIRVAIDNLRTERRHVERAWTLLRAAPNGEPESQAPSRHLLRLARGPAGLVRRQCTQTADELWVGYHKKATGRPSITWSQAVDEALCVGWIDGVRFGIDAERFAQRFTPRRKGSTWSAINVGKVAALTEAGRMRPAGVAAYEARTPERTGVYAYERDAAAFSPRDRPLPGR